MVCWSVTYESVTDNCVCKKEVKNMEKVYEDTVLDPIVKTVQWRQ